MRTPIAIAAALLTCGCSPEKSDRGLAPGAGFSSVPGRTFGEVRTLGVSSQTLIAQNASIITVSPTLSTRSSFDLLFGPFPLQADDPDYPDDPAKGVRFARILTFNSEPSVSVVYGMAMFHGLWRIPRTTRVRGGSEAFGSASAAAESEAALTSPPTGNALYEGILAIGSDAGADFWFWKPAAGSPQQSLSVSLASGAVISIPPDRYLRITPTGATLIPWSQPPGTLHEPRARSVHQAANAAAGAAGLEPLPPLTP